ncbi:MAG: PilZ domain-containing protein [Deltaproteobacteria bacterium]
MKNRREFVRVEVPVEADITLEGRCFTAMVIDVSMAGTFLACDAQAALGTVCSVVLFLDGRGGESRIEAAGKVVRVVDAGLGVEFEELVGLDSYWHLRSLVVFNADDPEQAEREVEEHIGIRRSES